MSTEQISLVYGVEFGQDCIRDNVYGDILIPRKFLPIIDSYEFQRLRNIKQLATAQYAFPGANHTRFAHSLGTFHVMQRIVAHFDRYFQALGQPFIPEREKELILAASLLHDLGHTPFSHALEDTLQNAQKIPHEKWTVDIIQHKSTSLYKALKDLFGENGPQEVASLINLQHDDHAMTPFFSASEIKLKNIFHSLISSQLDADRLDYIRRDSIAVGVSYGMIDLDRLIGGFRIGILDSGKAVVCVAEEHLSDVEGYLYARYQMYRNVYLSPFKMFTEELLRKIVRHVYTLYDRDCLKTSDLPLGFKPALQKSPMDMEDFLLLDDSVIMGAVKGWAKLRDERAWLLKELCQCMVQRNGYERYLFADISPETLNLFKKDLIGLLKPYIPEKVFKQKDTEAWIQDFPFIVLRTASPQLYKNERENIYVLENSGRIVDISDCSNLVRAFSGRGDLISAIYLNEEILKLYLEKETFFRGLTKKERDNLSKEVRKLFESRSARNSIEIEKKYYFPQEDRSLDWERVQMQLYSALSEMGYSVHPSNGKTCKFELPEPVTQTDYYFDTSEKTLHLARCSLRVRIKGDKAELTCKRPVSDSKSCGEQGQMERYEYAHILKNADLSRIPDIFLQEEGVAFVEKYLPGMVSCEELKTTITIINHRTRYIVEKQSDGQQIKEQYELAFDDVIFENKVTCHSYAEKQIELELKSDPSTRLNMQALTNHLERDFAHWNMTVMTESKYERAKKFTE
ncbi:MAG: CYTH domain-containing protein [Oscillospiraceae bacterium]|nr:CYTH domain-containing protein [Oscillospiraceae bacterium]